MRYDKICIVFLFACILILHGCKSRKEVTRAVTDQKRIERTETAVDTSRAVGSSQETLKRETSESEEIYSRTQHFDSLGNVRTIQEVWRRIGRFELDLFERSGSYLSLNGMSTVTSDRDSSTVVTDERQDLRTDSRPVQGFEWLWAIVGVGIIIFIVIAIAIKK
jgi:hypothetical protein